MMYFERGAQDEVLAGASLREALFTALAALGERKRVLIVPPDITRLHSQAGVLTRYAVEYYREKVKAILPATGTHTPMTEGEIASMFGDVPRHLFLRHDCRTAAVTVGEAPSDFVRAESGGLIDYAVPFQLNRTILEGGFDLVLSVGQVVPHEVVGMSNFNKNLFVGTGGFEGINRTHFLGAVYGMERIMGRADNPVRRVLNYGSDHFLRDVPVVYVQTVVERAPDGALLIRGLYVGDDTACFYRAAELSLKVNVTLLDRPLKKVIVYLDPAEFKSTWVGNKSIYRTRMAIDDGGELIVLAPGVEKFGEDKGIDALIRRYGYVGSPRVLELVKQNPDLQKSLSSASHLIHGSSEGRFSITYCPGKLTRQEIESVNFRYGDLAAMLRRYDPARLVDGFNRLDDGEEIFYSSQPALGLWAFKERFALEPA